MSNEVARKLPEYHKKFFGAVLSRTSWQTMIREEGKVNQCHRAVRDNQHQQSPGKTSRVGKTNAYQSFVCCLLGYPYTLPSITCPLRRLLQQNITSPFSFRVASRKPPRVCSQQHTFSCVCFSKMFLQKTVSRKTLQYTTESPKKPEIFTSPYFVFL